jgi:hypothetical protein
MVADGCSYRLNIIKIDILSFMKNITREWTKLNIFYNEDLKIQVLKILSKK